MKKLISILVCLVLAFTLASCSATVDADTAARYAQTFCQTTSARMWSANKSFLLKNVSEELEPRLEAWFDGSNYSDKMRVSVKSQHSDIVNGTGDTILLISCSNDNLSYWVVMTLSYSKNVLIDFTYKSIDQMQGCVVS